MYFSMSAVCLTVCLLAVSLHFNLGVKAPKGAELSDEQRTPAIYALVINQSQMSNVK